MTNNERTRNWCFTLNNWTPAEWEFVQAGLGGRAKYLVCGKEVGEAGTPHLQGYVVLKVPKCLSAVAGWFKGRAHLEKAEGDASRNLKYCSKEGDFIEYGERPRPVVGGFLL